MQIELKDGWCQSGKSIKEFVEMLDRLTDCTTCRVVEKSNIFPMTYLQTADVKVKNSETLQPAMLFKIHQGIESKNTCIALDHMKADPSRGLDEVSADIMSELKTGKTMLAISSQHGAGIKSFFISDRVVSMLGTRIGLGGDAFLIPSEKRNDYVSELLLKQGSTELTLVIREVGGRDKIFAVHSGTYTECHQDILADVIEYAIEEMGDPVCGGWYVDHNISEITLFFPEKAKEIAEMYELPDSMIPGIYLAISDTGECGITAAGCWKRPNGTIVYTDLYKRWHRGKVNEKMLMDEISKTIFDKYTELPKALCDAMMIDVPYASMEEVLEKLMTGTVMRKPSVKAIIGKRVANNILKTIVETELDVAYAYTAYDAITTVMDISGRLEKNYDKRLMRDTQDACGRVPYLNIERIVKAAV